MTTYLYSIISVLIIGLISLVGVFTLGMKKQKLENILFILVSFAVGALFGDALIHLIPESFESLDSQTAGILIIIGIIIFFILEKFIRWHHCHDLECKDSEHIHPAGTINIVSDALHNFIDGILIGASYIISIPLGIATTIAVLLHEIPQEIGDFGVLIHSGYAVKKALLFNLLSALFAIVGLIIVLIVGAKLNDYINYILPITAGGFLYIAGSDLIPELHKEVKVSRSLAQLFAMVFGVGIMILLKFVG